MKQIRADLTEHVGVPSIAQRALIEQIVQLRLRIAVMDRDFAESKDMTAHDSRMYLSWANSYSRLLRQLGLQPTSAPQPTLQDYLSQLSAADDVRRAAPPGREAA